MSVRPGYVGLLFSMAGPVVFAFFWQGSVVPALLWLAAAGLVITCASEVPRGH